MWSPAILGLRREEAMFHVMWEDVDVSVDLLSPRAGERVLCIASAGESGLAYAARGAQVRAFDVNLAQVRLVELKRAMLAALPGDDVRALLGQGAHPSFRRLLDGPLAPHLPAPARAWWRERRGAFDENFHAWGAGGLAKRWVRAYVRAKGAWPAIERLFACSTTAEQVALYEAELAPRLFGGQLAHAAARPAFVRLFGVPSAQAALLADYPAVLRKRFREVAETSLARHNPHLQLGLLHRYLGVPEFLEDNALDAQRAGLERHCVERGDIARELARAPAAWDCIDLLDAPDWLSVAQQAAWLRDAERALRPGGRLLLRSAGTASVAAAQRAGLALDVERSREATRRERTGFYRVTALLRKPAP